MEAAAAAGGRLDPATMSDRGCRVGFVHISCYHCFMTKLEKIEQEIAALSDGDRRKLAQWFAEFHAELWDRQIESDYDAGRLGKLIDSARRELAEGKSRPL